MIPNLILKTEVLPEDIPMNFSNKHLQKHYYNTELIKLFTELDEQNEHSRSKNLRDMATIPLKYYIPKNNYNLRRLGLLHPLAQLQITEFLINYSTRIVSECSKSNFSVRSPIGLNNTKINMKEYSEKKLRSLLNEFSTLEVPNDLKDLVDLRYKSFFTYKHFKSLKEMMESPSFNRVKHKFTYSLKIDIQKCFDSIYTHSLTWSILGSKELGKIFISGNGFAHRADKIMQKTNYNETNGIVIGNEFSRVVAEMLLSQIDLEIESTLFTDFGLNLNKDYKIYRFVDDYYIFSNSKEYVNLIQKVLIEILNNYNLNINDTKVNLQEAPFKYYDSSILKLKNLLSSFRRRLEINIYDSANNENHLNIGTRYEWKLLYNNVEELIIEYPESKSRIVKYFLKSIRNLIEYDRNNLPVIKEIIEILTNVYSLYIDINSTNNYIAIMLKLLTGTRNDNNDDQTLSKHSIIILDDLLFENCFRVIKNNEDSLSYMTDLITFMKLLDKKISAQYLCKILNNSKYNYFIYCTVGNYILEDRRLKVDNIYQIVFNKLKADLSEYITLDSNKKNQIILNSEYFYLINDFSKYPGLEFLKTEFENKKKEVIHNQNDILRKLWNNLTSDSYFKWNSSSEDLSKEFLKKIMYNNINIQFINNYDTPLF